MAAYQEKEAGGEHTSVKTCTLQLVLDTRTLRLPMMRATTHTVEMFTGGSLQSEGVFTPQQKAFDFSGYIFRSQASSLARFTLLGQSPQTAIAWRADTEGETCMMFYRTGQNQRTSGCSRQVQQNIRELDLH